MNDTTDAPIIDVAPEPVTKRRYVKSRKTLAEQKTSKRPARHKAIAAKVKLSEVKRLTQDELIEVGTLLLKGNMQDLLLEMENPNCSIIKMLVGSVTQRAIQRGDMTAFNGLLDRLVGKVADRVEVTANSGPQVIVSLPSNSRDLNKIIP
jgi:hypothetical protein